MRTLVGLALAAFAASGAPAQTPSIPRPEVPSPNEYYGLSAPQTGIAIGRRECLTQNSSGRTICRTREQWRAIAQKLERQQARTR